MTPNKSIQIGLVVKLLTGKEGGGGGGGVGLATLFISHGPHADRDTERLHIDAGFSLQRWSRTDKTIDEK